MWVAALGTDVFDATCRGKNFESDSIKRDASCMTNQGRLVLRNSAGAISLRALKTRPVENKKTFHLIRLFPLEDFINYRRK